MKEDKINQEKVEDCKKDNKTIDCKALLPKKLRCPEGKLQSSRGKCRPVNSPCLDSREYSDLI